MDCKTTGVTKPNGVGPVVKTAFRPGYALVSKQWDKQRVSLRLKYFQTTGKDRLFPITTMNGECAHAGLRIPTCG